MLYLVKSHDIIKIGSTKDLHKRIIAYKTSNPDAEFLELAEGYKEEEKELHFKLKKYKYKNTREWFIDCLEVRKIWEEYRKGKEISELELFKALPHAHKVDSYFIEAFGENVIYKQEIINLKTGKTYRNIQEWLDLEKLSSQAIYHLFDLNPSTRFKNPKQVIFPFGNGEKQTLDLIYKNYRQEIKI